MNTQQEDPIFGKPVYTYTRAQAIEDGEQIEISETAREAGISFPCYITRTVWGKYVEVPPGVHCQDESGRLWDICWMLACAVRSARESGSVLLFKLHVRNNNREGTPPLVTLKAVCGPVDMDNPAPSITIMLPEED